MPDLSRILIMTCFVTGVALYEDFVKFSCNPSGRMEVGLCLKRDDCNRENLAQLQNLEKNSNPIRCPASLHCCTLAETEPERPCGKLSRENMDSELPHVLNPKYVTWNVAFMLPVGPRDQGHDMLFLANGVLIHRRVVLTLAYNKIKKIDKQKKNSTAQNIYAVVGDYNQRNSNSSRKALKVETFKIHEHYHPVKRTNNVALAVLSRGVERDSKVVPICFPEQDSLPPLGTNCYFTGWGLDNITRNTESPLHQSILTMSEVKLIDQDTCTRGLNTGESFKLRPTHLCANRAYPVQDLCTGDGGSPLFCPKEDNPHQYVLSGLVMIVVECGPHSKTPVVFADVASLSEWIKDSVLSVDNTITID